MENGKKPINILIDTDIGGDIDDALALALALNSPELNIVGITTNYLSNAWRTQLTREMLAVFGREDIDVAMGAEKPLIGWWDDNHALPERPVSLSKDGRELPCACDYIVQKAEETEGLTIVAIGPMTSVGLAFAKAPHIASRVKVVLMGGQANKAFPEWNIQCDPEAASIVFRSGAPITMVGLDVTNRCTFTKEDIAVIQAADNPRARHLSGMLDTFLEKFGFLPVLHDPLALSSLLWDDLMTFEDKLIRVETGGAFTRGVTVDASWGNQERNARVAVDVKPEEFKCRLLERLTR
ncbi:MAG TPA: nucleoside hydrolase [Firmicutes bacterium]|nr:nucleoside hydrolase [Bacillota bacterium]